MDKKSSFPPSVETGAEVLLLGSMPGEESLRRQQYYAYRYNAFWKIMGVLFAFDPELPYEERLAALRRNRVALWDTLKYCRREGSPVPNDIPGLLKQYPTIRHIFCNGTAAFRFLKTCLPEVFHGTVPVTRLPSTRPAAAVYSFEQKLEAYRAIQKVLSGN